MKPAAVVLIVSLAAALAACGKSEEDTQAPASEPSAEAPVIPTEPAPPPAAEATPGSDATALSPSVSEAPPPPAAAPTPTAPPAPASAPRAAPAAPTPAAPTASESAPPAPAASVAPPSADLARGEQVYRKACAFCHDRGTAGAPKLGDAQAWAPRIAQGTDVLYTNSIKGIRAMPPKGGNPTLSETDVKAAVDFLVARAR